MCPLKNPILLDVFTETMTDSSREDSQAANSELDECLNDPLIDYKTGGP